MRSFCNVWDSLARLCMPRRLRFDADEGADDCTERGRQLLRDEQASAVSLRHPFNDVTGRVHFCSADCCLEL